MSKPKKILLTIDSPDMSGVAFSALNLARGLGRRHTKVMIAARVFGERAPSFEETGTAMTISKFLGIPALGFSSASAIRKFVPEIIHAQSCDITPRSYRIARNLGIPLVTTINRLDAENIDFIKSHNDIGIIAVSDAIRERLTNREGVNRDRIQVIPNGLDLSVYPSPDFDNTDNRPHVPVVGTYGTLIEEKGQRTFIHAASEVIKKGVDAEFLIMGRGPDKPYLRKMAKELGINTRVTFTPSTRCDMNNINSIDLFVEPTYKEGLGLSVLQAMAMGIPVVSSGVGGLFSLVEDGQTGTLIPSGDAEKMAEAIETMLANRDKRIEMARHAREKVEKEFNSLKIADHMLKYYSSIITQNESIRNA